ncbi:MAG: PAS domain S-box protein [Candidatus Omnitrophica bacterium]|nr:PAS domain S-box protein [Candidatus Omnitrophota bacterium]
MTTKPKDEYQSVLECYKKLANFSSNLRESYVNFFERLKDAVFVTDMRGCFIFFNDAAQELTGYQRNDVLGRHFRLLFTLDDLSQGFLFFHQTMQGCYSEHSRFRIRKNDGATRVVDVLASPVVFDGHVRAALTIAQDVTGQSSHLDKDRDRVKVFKEFSQDLERWDEKNRQVKKELQQILEALSRKNIHAQNLR